MGILEWSPDQFWKATPFDLSAAFDGWLEKNGHKDQPVPLTRAEMEALEAEIKGAAHDSH